MGVYERGGVLDERDIGDELHTDKAGMRNIGGERLKRRYCRDSIVTHCRKWPLRAIAFYLCDILKTFSQNPQMKSGPQSSS